MPSIYTPQLDCLTTNITLEGEEYHHLCHVKRIGIGQIIKLNNGLGIIAEAKIASINKRCIEIEITSQTTFSQPHRPYAISFALLKNKHDELLVEKCTELGVTAFFPIVTEHSVRTSSVNTIARFEKIALAAIKQCDNPFLPVFSAANSLEKVLHTIMDKGFSPILCSELKPESSIANVETNLQPCFLIGPEGGWSPNEFELFARLNIPSISICKLITRAETAAIAVAAQFAMTTLF